MGNSNPKYFSEREALDILGHGTWRRVQSQLDSLGGAIDMGAFHCIVSQKFHEIPRYLCECLFRGFANDIHSVVEVSDFMCTLAVVKCLNSTLLMSFVFHVYDTLGTGEVTRKQLSKLLHLAYGANISQYNCEFDLNKLFENTSTEHRITGREFETYRGPSRVFTEWITAVLSALLDPPPARLEALEIKYSTTREEDQMMMQYNIPKSLCNKLYNMFRSLCKSPGRPEMSLQTWLKLSSKYVHPALAFEIFRAKLHDVKVAWRFVDFFEFCYLFGLFLPNASEADAESHSSTTFSTLERQAAALCTIFQLAAERDISSENDVTSVPSGQTHPPSLLNVAVDAEVGTGGAEGSRTLVLYMRRLIYLLSISSTSKIPNVKEDTIGKLARRVSIDPAEKNSYAYAAATASTPISTPQFDVFKLSPLDTMTSAELDRLSNLSMADISNAHSVISPVVIKALLDLESSCKFEPSLKEYVGLLCGFSHFLPGFQQLSMLACCTFGVKPLVPELEKLYIIDLTLSRQDASPQTKEFPNGPIGTEWSLLSSTWLNSWRFFVGHKRRGGSTRLSDSAIKELLANEDCTDSKRLATTKGRKKSGEKGGGMGPPIVKNVVNAVLPMSLFSTVLKPFGDNNGADDLHGNSEESMGELTRIPAIDNFSIVRKRPALATAVVDKQKVSLGNNRTDDSQPLLTTTTVPILIPGLDISQHLELVPPDVYKTLFLWYGGGPQISRSVIKNELGKPELELYPLCIKVCRCDPNGNPGGEDREFIFSKMAQLGDVIEGVCSYYRCSKDNAKLWDYATTDWKTQKLLSNTTLTLAAAGIRGGQLVLLEVALGDGTWPRSQRQSELEAEHAAGSFHTSTSLTSLVSASKISSGSGLLARSRFSSAYNGVHSPAPRVPLNKGRVGLDNLGNTCYMSSSLQVLLHTDQLVEYFMRKAYLKHVNIHSKHGYKGRLAHAFGKLVTSLWYTDKSSVSPRDFRAELAHIRDEFSGNEQHDAQELMVFLLDGLSEDVNLVQEKPYIENPDSDDRSDIELANIWWANHHKREHSVIQALFTGQFKSVMHCSNCEYSSARFEPFNSLALPLLEDHTRTVYVDVISLGCKFRMQRCVVTVKRTDTLQAVVDKLIDPEFGILGLSSTAPHFIAADMSNCRVREFHSLSREVNNVLSNETIVLYEVVTPFASEHKVSTEEKGAVAVFTPGVSATEGTVTGDTDAAAVDIDTTGTADDMELESNASLVVFPKEQPGDLLPGNLPSEPVTEGTKSSARVVVLQRRAKYTVGAGVSNFSLEPIGVPVVDVVETRTAASDIYEMVSAKLKHCLKAPLDVLLHGSNSTPRNRHGVRGGLGTSSEASFSSNHSPRRTNASSAPSTEDSDGAIPPNVSDLKTYYGSESDRMELTPRSNRSSFDEPSVPTIRPVEIEEAVAKDISPYGFVLRYVRPDGVSCSKCPWIHGCHGCLLPDSRDIMIDIEDGTVFAADWHYVVYHELIECAGAVRGDIVHPSMENVTKDRNLPKISLSSCFDKFMEEEKLEGIVCPKCHEDTHLSKNFILWRLPPILFVQLKRFQFDRFSRRKLNDLVVFPLENLDLSPYLAKGSPHTVEGQETGKSESETEEVTNCCCQSSVGGSEEHVCSKYTLYAVVHHIGIMGGGHYVASVRDNSASMDALHANSMATKSASPQSNAGPNVMAGEEVGQSAGVTASSSPKSAPLSNQWWCYNDSTVTPIKEEDVVSPSAYLLFYMRDDIATGNHRLEDIFRYAEPLDEDIVIDQMDDAEDLDQMEEDCQPTRGAKYKAGDDVSTRRGQNTTDNGVSELSIDGRSSRTTHEDGPSVSTGKKRPHSGGTASSSHTAGDTSKKPVGYTEEEFEKIMQNGDTQQCSIS